MSTDRRHRRNWMRLRIALIIQGLLANACLETHNTNPSQSNECTACHGDAQRAGNKVNGDKINRAAPPFDLNGGKDVKSRGVGAHQNHLTASDSHEVVACTECHVVPEGVFGEGHFDAAGGTPITFGELAKSKDHHPTYDSKTASCGDTYCHQALAPANDPAWQAPRDSTTACGSCHGLPPAAPHPQSTACFQCHGTVIDAQRHFVNKRLHINGEVNTGNLTCNSCHGTDANGSPPPDLEGNTTSDSPGVGAHQSHLKASATHGAVACVSCHIVPAQVDSDGHIDDTRPADIAFSGLATSGNSKPVYDASSHQCSGSYCHGGFQPTWTAPRDSSAACGSCHGLPPPAPHPQKPDCATCHSQVIDSNRQFVNAALHVDGIVQVATSCNSCHGTDSSGSPPPDLQGNTTPDHPGVGAHQNHLKASSTHVAVACGSCHVVPADVGSAGHIDGALPAEVTFSGLSQAGGNKPAYDSTTHQCSGSYCHGGYVPTWTAPRDSLAACGSCHGLPPVAPHPQKADCSSCHSQVIGANQQFVNVALHIDGTVQVSTGCNSCHGSSADGAPPPDLSGSTDPSLPGVGAHQRHLQGSATHGAVACNQCHVVPASIDSPGHIDATSPADINFGTLATLNDPMASYSPVNHTCSNVYCHLGATPNWVAQKPESATCGTCHALPPPFVVGVAISAQSHPKVADCSRCHGAVIDQAGEFTDPTKHVNGAVDVAMTCNGCHGSSASPAPPTDLSGNTDRTAIGVGAHQAHLSGGLVSRPVPCAECHVVPANVNDPGHIDDWTIAEVNFSGAALANGRMPAWNRQTATCTNVWCHGVDAVVSVSPVWNDASVTLRCTSCHGYPPPAPHDQNAQCNLCHANIRSDGSFVDRSRHINGEVDFQ